MGLIVPDMEYFRAITDGEGEAIALKSQYEMTRASRERR